MIFLVYDSHCSLCTAFQRIARALGVHARVVPVALEDEKADRLLRTIPQHKRSESFHLVDSSSGMVLSGGMGFVTLLQTFPGKSVTSFLFTSRKLRFAGIRLYDYLVKLRERKECGVM